MKIKQYDLLQHSNGLSELLAQITIDTAHPLPVFYPARNANLDCIQEPLWSVMTLMPHWLIPFGLAKVETSTRHPCFYVVR